MPAESLRQRVARHVDPDAWARHDKLVATLRHRIESGKPLPWAHYESSMGAAAAETVHASLGRADVIMGQFLPLLREAGEGLEPFAKAIAEEGATDTQEFATVKDTDRVSAKADPIMDGEIELWEVTMGDYRRAAAIRAKIKELIDAEG